MLPTRSTVCCQKGGVTWGSAAGTVESLCSQPKLSRKFPQERYRYNGLHSAAQKGQARSAEAVLDYLTDSELYNRLYPDDSPVTIDKRMQYTLDLYLNTPDKGVSQWAVCAVDSDTDITIIDY